MSLNRAHVIELFTPGAAITARAAADITLGTLVSITTGTDLEHPTIQAAAAGTRVFGIAATDAKSGNIVLVQRGNGRCFRIPTANSIAAGANIEVGADGTPATATTGVVVAQALHGSANGYVDITLV